jgi:hypothetical protein
MKIYLGALGLLLAVLVSGCATPQPLRKPHVEEREFQTTAEAALAATRTVLLADGYRLQRSTPRWEVEALSPVRSSASFRESAQRRVRVKISPGGGPNMVRVSVQITDLEEGHMPVHGSATHETSVRSSAPYQMFFSDLEQRLRSGS